MEEFNPLNHMLDSIKLFFPHSRTTDPISSFVAGDKHEESGRAVRRRIMVYEVVKRYPGKTSKELSNLMELERHEIARRTADLRNGDWVISTKEGTGDLKWWLTDAVPENLKQYIFKPTPRD